METTVQRLPLSYQGATYHRSRILLAVTGVILLITLFVKFPKSAPPPGAVAGPPAANLLLGFIGFICFIYAIMDALFVAGVRSGGEKSCDQDNLYIEKRNKQTIIPLATIATIRLAPGGIGNGARGTYATYVIEYDYNGVGRSIDLYVYRRTQDSFSLFKERVQQKNPSVEIRNWSTSVDGLIRLFRRK